MIPVAQLQTWLKNYSIASIEQALVREYCQRFSIDWQNSALLRDFFAFNEAPLVLRKLVASFHIDSLKLLESTLELIIPPQDRKLNGAFFTPCDANTRLIITPYSVNNGVASIIEEEILKKEYPYCYEYLCAVRGELAKRDKGKMKGAWYGFGRTQGIAKRGRKLITPTFSKEPRFLRIDNEEAYFCNGYGLFVKQIQHDSLFAEVPLLGQEENLEVMQAILNSRLMHYYITRTSVSIEGGYYCYQKNFIEKFTIPNLSAGQIEQLRALEGSAAADEYLCGIYGISISHIAKPFLVDAE